MTAPHQVERKVFTGLGFKWPPAGAVEVGWNPNLNGNAETGSPNSAIVSIASPLVFFTTVGQGPAPADDFCVVAGGRTYETKRCTAEFGAHRGGDVHGKYSDGSFVQASGLVRVVAPVTGTVVSAQCSSGAGGLVKIQTSTGLVFWLQHMTDQLQVVTGQSVTKGQWIGRMSNKDTAQCGAANGYGVHVHFELRSAPGTDSYLHPRDPYPSIRESYSPPGLMANGTVEPDGPKTWEVWNFLVAVLGGGWGPGYGQAVETVGWPTGGPSWTGNMTLRFRNTNPADQAYVTYLSNGTNTFDTNGYRIGAIVYKSGNPAGFWIHDLFWKKWRDIGQQNSTIGWPIGNDNGTRQNFQQGCIRLIGGVPTSGAYGSSTCP